jgi:hypothetical protein
VPFDPPLAGYEEVKPRLLGMKVDAEQALGMVNPYFFSLFAHEITASLRHAIRK